MKFQILLKLDLPIYIYISFLKLIFISISYIYLLFLKMIFISILYI